jgi:glycosyltransferase involved in cell wall biosynthesis
VSAPRVSVVVPVHDGEEHVADALASVLAQTVDDLELIVVDDGSTDGTAEVVAGFTDSRVVVVRQENRGLPAARNAGIGVARGEAIAFLDHDDVWLPGKLAAQLELLDRCEACCAQFEEVDEELRTVLRWDELADRYPFERVDARVLVERGNLVAGSGSAVLARTAAVREAGGFDERLVAAEDLDLWYRLARRQPIERVQVVLVRIRRRSDQMQSDFGRVLRGRVQFLENVRRDGDPTHSAPARSVERRLRSQLLRRRVALVGGRA